MTALQDQIEAAEAHLAILRQQAAASTCAVAGHRWQVVGGANAGCDDDCSCTTLVRECAVCGTCDYGEPGRSGVIAACVDQHGRSLLR